MKKIIWLFGQPGAGRKTFANNIMNNTGDINETLGIDGEKISFVNLPYGKEKAMSDYRFFTMRKDTIYKNISDFANSDNDVIIINGEYVDYENKNNSILNTIAIDFSDIEKQIIILSSSDLDVAYERMKKTEWFKSDYEKNINKFPKEWLAFAVKYMKDSLYNFEGIGYKVYEIDTVNGYLISNNGKSKTM